MQIYMDLIARRKALNTLDMRKIPEIVEVMQVNNMLPSEATDLQILKCLCEVLYAVHYLADANDLPLDDAYSKMLMHNKIVKETDDPIEYIFTRYRSGQLRKAASPIHALMERVADIEKVKDKEIQSLKEQRAALAKRLEENGIPLI